MYYGCWHFEEFPKDFCKRNFTIVSSVNRWGNSKNRQQMSICSPHKETFFHWKKDGKDDLILMFIHKELSDRQKSEEMIPMYVTDIPFFKKWIGGLLYYEEINAEEWRKLDKFIFNLERPAEDY